ncbi:Chaperone protein DnaK [termite gut metagenome]|uniref:Chaperone protein DnaK n=1 Tax=termite gut metagenome TaxID=433724 RepID=A0A5J4RBT3_9ZZZZ
MANELTIQHLLPTVSKQGIVKDKLKGSTFIGIDFGTSTTVVSYTIFGDDATPIKTDVMPIRQINPDGSATENYLVPSCIAWYDSRLFIGQTAKLLKGKLTYGRNLWYSFKMKIGTDNGPVYFSTELPKGHDTAVIENPLDATKVFFAYLKKEIDFFIQSNNLPQISYYSISIPASFEGNQRKDLKEALDYAGIAFQDSLFIDEPNAAFLSYLIETNANNLKNYNIPLDSPLHILVFDFGAGTCDISVLEIGRKLGKLYSKNIAISKFEQLGGDDIDKQIVKDILYPQLLKQNGLELDDIKTPEYVKIILPKLQPIAEYLKIQICKTVARNMIGRTLPTLASSTQEVQVEQSFQILLPRHQLSFSNPTLSFKEFNAIMDKFTDPISMFDFQNEIESLKSIFTVIQSAIQKVNTDKDSIDLVLLIGGSSYNPYIQTSLRKYFDQSEIEIPQDLQAHVSTGAAVNSFLQNGMGINMIKPIISEPILIILQNNIPRTIVREGAEIPCSGITIDNLHPQKDNQYQIEIPICVSNNDKILAIVKIQSEDGFKISDKIRLECEISYDKLIYFNAFVKDMEVQIEPLNPFANSALSTEEIAEKRLLKAINEAAKKNGGRPPVVQLKELSKFYVKLEKHLKAAETLETIQMLEPQVRHETSICYHYSCAGKTKLSNKWVEEAYKKNPDGTNAYNLALYKEREGDMEAYTKLMKEAVDKDFNVAKFAYGEYLLTRNKDEAKILLQKVVDIWYNQYESNSLDKNNYSRLIRAARQIGRMNVADQVEVARSKLNNNKQVQWYNAENLASDGKTYLPKITE